MIVTARNATILLNASSASYPMYLATTHNANVDQMLLFLRLAVARRTVWPASTITKLLTPVSTVRTWPAIAKPATSPTAIPAQLTSSTTLPLTIVNNVCRSVQTDSPKPKTCHMYKVTA